MKTRDTIILLVVVGVVGLFIFLFERNMPSTGEMRQRQGRIFTQFDMQKVSRISIEGAGHELVLGRQEGEDLWRIEHPVQAEADGALVDGLLSDLEFMEPTRKVEDATAAQRKSFGLVDPSLTVEVGQEGGALKFVLGSEAEAGGYYLAVDGDDDVYVVDPYSVETLQREPGEFREKRLLGMTAGDVQGVRVTYTDGTTATLENTHGAWTLTVGDEAPQKASQSAAEKLARALSTIKALEFLEDGVRADEMGKKGFASAPPSVHFTMEDGTSGKLVFGTDCETGADEATVRALLEPGGTLVCVGRAARDTIMTPLSKLRLTSPAEVDAFEVQTIEARRGDELLSRVERDDQEGWRITAPTEKRAESVAVEAFLSTLGSSRSSTFEDLPADLSTVGLDPATATEITILDVAGDVMAHFWLANRPDGTITFRREGESMYGVLEPDPVLSDAGQVWALLERQVVQRDYFSAVRFELQGLVSHVLEKSEGAWHFVSPEGLEADAADVRDTVETACALEAMSFLGEASPAVLQANGLTDPEWTVQVFFETESDPGSEDVVRILLGTKTDQGRAALVEGTDAVMLLSDQVAQRLTRPLADRNLAPRLGELTSMGVSGARGQATFTVDSMKVGKLMQGDQGAYEISEVQTLLDALGSLRMETVVGYGQPPAGSGLGTPVLTVTLQSAGQETEPTVLRFGGKFTSRDQELLYTRVSGIDATFGVSPSLVEHLR